MENSVIEWLSLFANMVIAVAAVVALFLPVKFKFAAISSKSNAISNNQTDKKRSPKWSLFGFDIFRRSSMRRVFREAKRLARQMGTDGFKPTLIVFIGRGGAIFGALISYNLKNTPIFCVDRKYDWNGRERKVKTVFPMEQIPMEHLERVLLVAGEAHGGGTMRYYCDEITRLNPKAELKTCVFFRQDSCQMRIDYVGRRGRDYILMPWHDADFIRDSWSIEEANKLE